jgi:hypothetical protein
VCVRACNVALVHWGELFLLMPAQQLLVTELQHRAVLELPQHLQQSS